jgi:hypothetical protein
MRVSALHRRRFWSTFGGRRRSAPANSAPACGGQASGDYPAPRTLTPVEIDAVVAYLQARIVGKGRITRAECLAYCDDQQVWCEEYK